MMQFPSAQEAGDYSEGGEGDLDASVTVEVPRGVAGERIDKVLASLLPRYSRARIQDWLARGRVWINDKVATARQPVYAGDVAIVLPEAPREDLAFQPEPIEFEVVYESPQVIVVNKRAGLVVHPGSGNWEGTLLNGLLHRYPELVRVPRAGIVHRLDKDTTGLMVVAHNAEAQTALVRALQAHAVAREYVCLVRGWPADAGTCDEPIGRDPRAPVRMAVVRGPSGKPAVTHYRVEARGLLHGQRVARVECRLETGRTHQIRVHMTALGHPLLGDPVYRQPGAPRLEDAALCRQMLHARRLAFADPGDGAPLVFTCAPPADMTALDQRIDWE